MRIVILAVVGFLGVLANRGVAATLRPPVAFYWSDFTTGTIQRNNLDGSNPRTVVSNEDGIGQIQIDEVHQRLYWINNGAGEVRSAKLDGSDRQTLVGGMTFPLGLALDVDAGKMYFSNQHAGTVSRANLDGTGFEEISSGQTYTGSIAVDLLHDKVYWTGTDNGLSWNIRRSNLDGSSPELVTNSLSPQDIDFDLQNGKLYWTDRAVGMLYRANLDGTNREEFLSFGRGPRGLALDLFSNQAYWTDDILGQISRTDLATGITQTLITGINRPGYPYSIILTSVPEPSSLSLAGIAGWTLLTVARRRKKRHGK